MMVYTSHLSIAVGFESGALRVYDPSDGSFLFDRHHVFYFLFYDDNLQHVAPLHHAFCDGTEERLFTLGDDGWLFVYDLQRVGIAFVL
jgi:hypothetical protein